MPIKKRTNTVFDAPVEDEGKLNIVAKPKKPIPAGGKLQDVYGDNPSPAQARRLGHLAIDCGDSTPDMRFTVEDRLRLVRMANNRPDTTEGRQERFYRNRVRNRGTAITAYCITCVGGRKAITECAVTDCPLWAFRFGSDPFYGKKK